MFWIWCEKCFNAGNEQRFYFFWVKIVKKQQLIFVLKLIHKWMTRIYRSRKFGIRLKANTQTNGLFNPTRQAKMERTFERIKQTSNVFVSISWKLKKTRTANYIQFMCICTMHGTCSMFQYIYIYTQLSMIEVVSSKYVKSKFKQRATIEKKMFRIYFWVK